MPKVTFVEPPSKPATHRSRSSRHARSHDHTDSHSRHKKSAEDPNARAQIELVDLDDARETVKVKARSTSRLIHVETFLRQRFKEAGEDGPAIQEKTKITFFVKDKRLLGTDIPKDVVLLRYRVNDENEKIRIEWSDRVNLRPTQIEQLDRIIEGPPPGTIGTIRKRIALFLGVDDPKRIIISAKGGLRPGPLQGDSWETWKIKTWLCRIIYIDLVPAGQYLVFKGVNQELLCHPPASYKQVLPDLRVLRKWLMAMLSNVHRHCASRLKFESDDIKLYLKGKLIHRRNTVQLGKTLEFELNRDVEERFMLEEAWLIPLTESCVVCSEDKRITEMPSFITKTCDHDAMTCRDCIGQWIASSLDMVSWDRLKCPECPQLLDWEDVRTFAPVETFRRYDDLATKAALTAIQDFRWCLNPRCKSGQIHRADCPKVKCHACKAASCSLHNVPWHSGETCGDYDKRNKKQRKNEKASEDRIRKITKACPQCHKDVQKFSGCDHITCVCGHEWCYVCLSAYFHDDMMFLQCKHKEACKYYDNPPNYEGGRAFMPFLEGERENPFRPRHQPAPINVGGNREARRRFHDGRGDHLPPAPAPPGREPLPFVPRRPVGAGNVERPFAAFVHNWDINDETRQADNEFVGTAARFTMEHLMQRTRRGPF